MESLEINKELKRILLPEELSKFFDIEKIIETEKTWELTLYEKEELIPPQLNNKKTIFAGFCNPIGLKGFSVNGKTLNIKLYYRFWKEEGSEESYKNSYDFCKKGFTTSRKSGMKKYFLKIRNIIKKFKKPDVKKIIGTINIKQAKFIVKQLFNSLKTKSYQIVNYIGSIKKSDIRNIIKSINPKRIGFKVIEYFINLKNQIPQIIGSLKNIKKVGLKIIDYYIIRKFLGTYFSAILLMITIAVVFDFSEKLDDFIESDAPVKAIIFNYYCCFIPYFALLYSHLFTFIAVIFFTSKLAYRTEIIAILSSGISYRRIIWPYLVSAFIIALFTYILTNFVVPNVNKIRLEFEEVYVHGSPVNIKNRNIHKQLKPGVYIYMQTYSNISNMGNTIALEKYENNKLVSKLVGDFIVWDSIKKKWNIRDYYIRNITGLKEKIIEGTSIDTTLNMSPEDFRRRSNIVESMDLFELNKFIKEQKLQGAENIETYLIEKYKRVSTPFSTFILTVIGVCISSRKNRGGTGLHLGVGLGFCFSYIVFMQFSSQFAISGSLDPVLAVWLPNIIYAIIAYYLYKLAPK